MQIGLILPTIGHGAGPDSLEAGGAAAESVGWSSVWATDHLIVGQGDEAEEYGWILEALTSLAWVAARHPKLRLGTSVIVPAMRDAPQLAKELATIDVLSGGRLTVGVGVGDRSDEPEWRNLGKGHRLGVRGAYLDETIALWRHLWSGSTKPFHGRFHQLESFVFAPLPMRRERVPIWTGGKSERAVERAATLADGYHASQTGPDALRDRLPTLLARARAVGRPRPSISVRVRLRLDMPPGPAYSLCGSSRAMIADLDAFARLGVDELVVVPGVTAPDEINDTIQRFDRNVVRPWREVTEERMAIEREQTSM